MPRNFGQWTGIAVTAIIVLGCDMDIVYAMPLGIMAGALATFFVTLADMDGKRFALRRLRRNRVQRFF